MIQASISSSKKKAGIDLDDVVGDSVVVVAVVARVGFFTRLKRFLPHRTQQEVRHLLFTLLFNPVFLYSRVLRQSPESDEGHIHHL